MTLDEVEAQVQTRNDPRVQAIDARRVRIEWAAGYWDGPRDGLAQLDDRTVWFRLAEELFEPGASDAFWLVELSNEQCAYWLQVRSDFERLVGTHMSFGADGRNGTERRPTEQSVLFTQKYAEKIDPDLSDNEVIGWCVPWP